MYSDVQIQPELHLLSGAPPVIKIRSDQISNADFDMEYDESHQITELGASPPGGSYAMSPDSGYAMSPESTSSGGPFLTILEEPENSYRFRYKKESQKPHGPLKGRNSVGKTQKNSNGPRIKLHNFEGEGIIRVWLHCQNEEEGPSPHRLVTVVGRDDIKDEPHDLHINKDNDYTVCFNKLNILHVVTNDVPYQKCYERKKRSLGKPGSIYVRVPPNVVHNVDERKIKGEWKKMNKDICSLRFEAFEKRGDEYYFIGSLLSEAIKNKKSPKTNGLRIVKSSHVQGSCEGGTEVLIFTEKMIKEVRIIFFDDEWQADAIFKESDIHKQVGVAFRTPPYKNVDITEEKTVRFKIQRTTDGEESEDHIFRYQPREDNMLFLDSPRKRKKPQVFHDPMLSVAAVFHHDDSMDDVLQPMKLLAEYSEDTSDGEQRLSIEEEVNTDDLLTDSIPDIALYNLEKDSIRIKGSNDAKVPVQESESMAETARRLMVSIVHSDSTAFTELIKIPHIVNFKYANTTPLHLAVKHQKTRMVSDLLRAGANVYGLDNNGSNTALHLAIQASSLTCLELLLRSAEPKAVFNEDGDDPVLHATRNSRKDSLELLLLKGFSPSTENVKDGDTPLHVAVENCLQTDQYEIVNLLLKSGASASEYNNAGLTPLHYAASAKNNKLVEKLIQYSDAEDYSDDEGDDQLSNRMSLLQLANDPNIKSNLENFLGTSEGEKEAEDAKEPFLALDGDVELSKKVATRLGCAFLIPFLVTAEKQSQVLLNHLQRKNGVATAVNLLNGALAKESIFQSVPS